MNATPPPFGEPTKVQVENKKVVGRGILFGCGGCLLVIFALMLFASAIFAVVMYALRSTDVVQITTAAAQASPELKAELGEPLEVGWLITGSVKTTGGAGRADVNVPLSGPKGSATIHTVGSKKSEGTWEITKMTATIDGTDKSIDLRQK